MKKLAFIILSIVAYTSVCGQPASCSTVCPGFNPAMWETPSRDPLRKELVSLAGPLKGKTVLDIGAGSGYFTFEFAKQASKVVATELDARFLDYIDQKKSSQRVTNIETRLADATQVELANLKQVDVALMVQVYHFLDDPKDFLGKLRKTMNKGGQVIIVNSEHFSSRFITDYLESTGYKDISIKKFSVNNNCGEQKLNIVMATNL